MKQDHQCDNVWTVTIATQFLSNMIVWEELLVAPGYVQTLPLYILQCQLLSEMFLYIQQHIQKESAMQKLWTYVNNYLLCLWHGIVGTNQILLTFYFLLLCLQFYQTGVLSQFLLDIFVFRCKDSYVLF